MKSVKESERIKTKQAGFEVDGMARGVRYRMYRSIEGFFIPGYSPYCYDLNDPETVRAAVYERLFRDVPKYKEDVMCRFRHFCRVEFPKMFRKVKPLEFEEWLATTHYNENRKNQLRIAYLKLRGGVPTDNDMKVKFHVKQETYDVEQDDEEYKPPRGIFSRKDAFKAYAGRFIKAVEQEVYSTKWFIKHIPIPKRPAFIAALNKLGAFKYESDYSRYESSFIAEIMRACEFELYEYMLSDYPEFLAMYDYALCNKNKIFSAKGCKGRCRALRMSGEMSTSLGNGITNLMIFLFICHEHQIEFYDAVVEGDDGLYVVSKKLKKEWFAELGFLIKLEQVEDLFHANFCGMTISSDYEIIRNPRYVLSTFGWVQGYLESKQTTINELLRAKALSVCYEIPQCPIVGALARKALVQTRNCRARWIDDGYHTPCDEIPIPAFKPSLSTRLLVQDFFHISIEQQKECEKLIMSGHVADVARVLAPFKLQEYYYSHYVGVQVMGTFVG